MTALPTRMRASSAERLREVVAAPPDGRPRRRLRVLVTTGSAELYGSDRMMFETVVGLLDRGHHVVVVFGADGPMVGRVREAGAEARVVPVPVARRAYLTPRGLFTFGGAVARAVPALRRLVRDVGPDVVYVNTLTLPVWVGVARLTGIPCVVHVHEAEAGRPRPVRLGLEAPLIGATDIVFNSEHSASVARGDLGRALPPSCVVLNGVVVDEESPTPRETLTGPIRLVYVGRLSPRKGVDVAVDAIARLRERGVDAHLDIVGDVFDGYEWYRDDLQEQIARLGLGDSVRLLGFREPVRDDVRAADIALAPTRRDEPFGNVLIEGIGAKRPFVAAAQTGLLEAGRGLNAVRYAAPGDAGSLADAVHEIVLHWAERRASVCVDADVVRRRHDPVMYRRRVCAVIELAADARRRCVGR